MQCTTDHTGDSLSFCTVLVQCLLSVILQDRAHVLHGSSHLVGGQASRLFSSVVMKTACTLDRCWLVGRQAAYAQFGVLRDLTSTVIALLSRTVFIHSGSGTCACASWLQTEKSAEAKFLEEQKRQVEEGARVERLRTVREMATRRHVQEALQQLQLQEQRVAALEIQQRME